MHQSSRLVVGLLLVGCYANLALAEVSSSSGAGTNFAGANVYYNVPAGVAVRQPAVVGPVGTYQRRPVLQPTAVGVPGFNAAGGVNSRVQPSSYTPALPRVVATTGTGARSQPAAAVEGSCPCSCTRENATAERIANLLERVRQLLPFKQQQQPGSISREDGPTATSTTTVAPAATTPAVTTAAVATVGGITTIAPGTFNNNGNANVNNNNNANVNNVNSYSLDSVLPSTTTTAVASSSTTSPIVVTQPSAASSTTLLSATGSSSTVASLEESTTVLVNGESSTTTVASA